MRHFHAEGLGSAGLTFFFRRLAKRIQSAARDARHSDRDGRAPPIQLTFPVRRCAILTKGETFGRV